MLTKEEFCRQHLRRQGNPEPSEEAVEIMLRVLDNDPWVQQLYERANAMTAEVYNALPTIEPEEDSD